MNYLAHVANGRGMAIYVRFLALVFAYGASVHFANVAGLGEMPWLETPLSWRIGDIVYGILDMMAMIGLWRRKGWGLAIAISTLLSQVILYTCFIDTFAITPEQRSTIYGLVGTELVLLAVLAGLWLIWQVRKPQPDAEVNQP